MHAIITVGNLYSSVRSDEPFSELLIYGLQRRLSYVVKDAFHKMRSLKKKDKNWDGEVKLFWPERGNLFYTGMLADVRDILTESGYSIQYEFTRIRPEENVPLLEFIRPEGFLEREYQTVTVDMLYEATRGILQAATGAGKTLMAAQLISRIKTAPFIFYVMSTDLLEQTYTELSNFLNVPIGRVGGGIVDIQDVNVVMLQTAVRTLNRKNSQFNINLHKYDEEDEWLDLNEEEQAKGEAIEGLIRGAKGIFADECHHVACRSFQEVLEASKYAYWRYGGSATPEREDGQGMMIQALFGRKIVSISASLLIKEGFLVRPYIFNVELNENHGDFEAYSSIYKNYIVENESLHILTSKLIDKFEGDGISSLTLVKQYSHGDKINKIRSDDKIPFIKGNQSKKKRLKALDGLRSGEVPSAIATTLADEGLDVKRLGAVIIAGGGKSVTRIYQRVGRALRIFTDPVTDIKKRLAIIIIFHHKCKYLDYHGKTIKRLLATEPAFIIADSTPEEILGHIDEVLCNEESLFEL